MRPLPPSAGAKAVAAQLTSLHDSMAVYVYILQTASSIICFCKWDVFFHHNMTAALLQLTCCDCGDCLVESGCRGCAALQVCTTSSTLMINMTISSGDWQCMDYNSLATSGYRLTCTYWSFFCGTLTVIRLIVKRGGKRLHLLKQADGVHASFVARKSMVRLHRTSRCI